MLRNFKLNKTKSIYGVDPEARNVSSFFFFCSFSSKSEEKRAYSVVGEPQCAK